LQLQQSILPDSIPAQLDQSVEATEALWIGLANSLTPAVEVQHIQKAWNKQVVTNHQVQIFSRALCDVDRARLLVVASLHSDDWLHAPPITSVSLRLSDEAIRIAVARRLGCKACEPHISVCGKAVDAQGLHGLSCRKTASRQQRHSHINDIIWRAIKRAQIPALK